MTGTLLQIVFLFGVLSLLAVGGGNGVIPDMQRAAVELHHWMTPAEFLDAFAISRAAPGPGSLIVVLVGQKAAGLAGAVAAAVAMYTPSCTLVYGAAYAWRRWETRPWRRRLERALGPVAVGLTFGSGLALVRGTEHGPLALGLTAAATGVLALTAVNPLLVMLAGAAIGLAAA